MVRLLLALAVVAPIVLVSGGCGGGSQRSATATPSRTEPAPRAAPALPSALADVEPAAERVVELAARGRAHGADLLAHRLSAAARTAGDTAARAGVAMSLVRELRARATELERARNTGLINLALSANALATWMSRMNRPYRAADDYRLIALAGADREILLRARPDLSAALVPAVNALTALWIRVRSNPPAAMRRAGGLARYEDHVRRIEALTRAQRLSALRREAQAGDGLLDEPEDGAPTSGPGAA